MVDRFDLSVPLLVAPSDTGAIARVDLPARERRREQLERRACICRYRQPAELLRVEARDVNVDELHIRILKGRVRGRGEVRPARADADHEVRFARRDVRSGRARDSHGAERAGIVEAHRTLPRHGLGHGNSGGGCERAQRIRGFGVDHAAAGNDERALRRSHEHNDLAEQICIGRGSMNPVHALPKEMSRDSRTLRPAHPEEARA